jgi:hypothetical protein
MAENRAADINGDEDEEEALRIAIALSLGQDPNSASVGLTQDEPTPEKVLGPAPPAIPAPAPAPVSGLFASGLDSLDRKQMEEERLARVNKRKASELGSQPTETARPQQRQKMTDDVPKSQTKATPPTSSAMTLPFPKGVVKKTWAYGQPRVGDDIKIEEVLQKDKLELAVLSSFQWDEKWMLSKLDMDRTKLCLVAFANNDAQVGLA